jgi:hypothetical protein
MLQPRAAPHPITYSTAPSGRLICWVVVQEAKIATTERQPKNLEAAFIAPTIPSIDCVMVFPTVRVQKSTLAPLVAIY